MIKATNATFAMAIGYGVTSLIGLTLNNRWVFNAHAQFKSVVMKYYVTYLFTWIISVGFANAASSWSQMNTTLIPLFSLILTVPTNFLLSKFWVFHRQKLKEVRQNGNQP
ncbi:MAG: GtrA family protein [Lentilactobacillus diolivorans]